MRLCFLVGMAFLLCALLPVSGARGASIGVEGVKYFSNRNAPLDLQSLQRCLEQAQHRRLPQLLLRPHRLLGARPPGCRPRRPGLLLR